MERTISQVFKTGYLILFVMLVFANNNLLGFAICAFTILGLVSGNVSIEIALMASLVLGNEITSILHLAICTSWLLSRHRVRFGKVNAKVGICVIVILASSIVNIVISGAFYGPIFGMLYYAIVIFLAFLFKGALNEGKLIESIKFLIYIEFFASCVNIVLTRSFHPGDLHKGTLPNAHYFAFWLICVLVYMFIYFKERRYSLSANVRKNIPYYIAGIFMLLMSDGKNVIAGFALTFVIYAFSYVFSKKTKNRIVLSITILYAGTFVLILFLHLSVVKSFIVGHFPNVSIYLYDSMYAYKFMFFEGTLFEELKGIRSLFGYGIGQYGSRFANLLGYKFMYREDNFINNFIANHLDSFILPNYEKYASLYTKTLVDNIRWRSAVLSYPFSSVIAFLAENGIIGLTFITYIWGKMANKSKYGILVIFLFSSCIFDIYFDHISILALTLVLISSGEKKQMAQIGKGSNTKLLGIDRSKR